MGTHPIFESDFDCLTEKIKMAINMNGLMADLGLDEKANHYDDHYRSEEEQNENFIEMREKRRATEKLLFERGGKSKEAYFEHLSAQCEPISGTNGGVLIQKQALWESPGEGETIGAICDRFDKTEPDLAEVSLGVHYAAYLKDELDKEPFDYTYARGRFADEFFMRQMTLLPG